MCQETFMTISVSWERQSFLTFATIYPSAHDVFEIQVPTPAGALFQGYRRQR